jgi:prepilin-type N-terminal cleavage/methylation domain-containing protein
MLSHLNPARRSGGFTLVEMSIVLIIIGIILGAVIKGKDLIRSGEQKRIYNSFIKQWQIVYQDYFDRTGWILGDVADSDNGTAAGGRDGAVSLAGTDYAGDATLIADQLARVGLSTPTAGSGPSPLQYPYQDSTGTQRYINLAFQANAAWGNHIRITSTAVGSAGDEGPPNDLALALDRLIDGQADGTRGEVTYDTNRNNGAQNTAAWPSAEDDPTGPSAMIVSLPF